MTNDAAVAWLVTNGGLSCEPWLVWELSEVKALPSSCIAEPLYSATTVAELRALIARAIPFLDDHHDAGPPSAGYKSDALESLITEMRNTLRQEKPE